MENGTMRVDANISVRPKGTSQMNTKVEVKNMNSVRHVGDAIAHEIGRQSQAVQTGEAVVLHTRLWDPDKKVTLPMRGKFEGPCVPDPMVPVIELTPEWIEKMRTRLPDMPAARAGRFVAFKTDADLTSRLASWYPTIPFGEESALFPPFPGTPRLPG